MDATEALGPTRTTGALEPPPPVDGTPAQAPPGPRPDAGHFDRRSLVEAEDALMGPVLAACVHHMHVPVTVVDARAADMPMIYVNPAYAAVTGYPAGDLIGRNGRMLQGPGTDPAVVAGIAEALAGARPAQVRVLNYRPDGSSWWNEMHISPIRDRDGAVTHWMGVSHDVSESVSADAAALHAAGRDALTGLPGRAELRAALAATLRRSHERHDAAAVLYCDVDRFKDVNDGHGHRVGDLLLETTANRLRSHLRAGDIAARVGGDEFVVLLGDLPHEDARQVATRRAQQLTTALAAPLPLPTGDELTPAVSVGVALYPHDRPDHTDVDALVAAADTDMYAHKPHHVTRPTPTAPTHRPGATPRT